MSTSPDRPRRVSLADVARIAGVSSNTVSRVVRGDPEVADATRKRISEILTQVGYRPHLAARALAAKRTDVIQVILAAPMFHGHGQTLLSVMTEAATAGLSIVISHAEGDATRDVPIPFDVDGVIILGGQEPTVEMAVEAARHMPTVLLLSNQQELPGVSTVSVDNYSGGYQAARHLLDHGVERIVHIQGEQQWSDAAQRRDGCLAACEESGVTPMALDAGSWDAVRGYHVMSAALTESSLLQGSSRFGVFAANDQLALGVVRAAHEQNVSIPEKMGVVGFDDTEGAACFTPPLTTIRQGFDSVGAEAVHQLARLRAGEKPRDVLIEPELVIRASSTPRKD